MTALTQTAQRAIKLIDLTLLNTETTEAEIVSLCQQAKSPAGNTAAVCIYPRFIPLARKTLNDLDAPNIRIVTVTNFPQGSAEIQKALEETGEAIELGADEIDVVFPYRELIKGNSQVGYDLVNACKTACAKAGVLLKVILETGELKAASLIRHAAEIAIDAGADFIKTSTGKVSVNATPETAKIMLEVIRHKGMQGNVGFKPAGGVRTLKEAVVYLALADNIMGTDWSVPRYFRFGASSLLSDLLKYLGYTKPAAPHQMY